MGAMKDLVTDIEMKIVPYLICGVPGAGKTTLAESLGRALDTHVLSTDDYLYLLHEDSVQHAYASLEDGETIVEGCEATRLLKLGLQPTVVLWLGPTDPAKVLPKYRGLVQAQLNALSTYQPSLIYRLPRRPELESVFALPSIPHLPFGRFADFSQSLCCRK